MNPQLEQLVFKLRDPATKQGILPIKKEEIEQAYGGKL